MENGQEFPHAVLARGFGEGEDVPAVVGAKRTRPAESR